MNIRLVKSVDLKYIKCNLQKCAIISTFLIKRGKTMYIQEDNLKFNSWQY